MSSEGTVPTRESGVPIQSLVATVLEGPDTGATATTDDVLSIGTADGNSLVLHDRTASRFHLELRREGAEIVTTDLGSRNGTWIGPARLRGASAAVRAGTTLVIGKTPVRIDDGHVHEVHVARTSRAPGVVGSSVAIRRLTTTLENVAGKDVPVLITGESGTGKEVFARALHELGGARGPFVVVDCGAVPASLFASELFGHERGAFTGADRRRSGAIELASGGTLFLDEIGELTPDQQVSLLGVLERRRYRRVGGQGEIELDCRVVAATHRDLRAKVNDGSFRLDLYYRIAVVVLTVPPLRDRPEDVPLLMEHFARELGYDEPFDDLFEGSVVRDLQGWGWEGNVRELRNVVASTLATGKLPQASAGAAPKIDAIERGLEESYRDARARVLREFEARYLPHLLERADGNVREAARIARVDRTYLTELLRRHGLRRRTQE